MNCLPIHDFLTCGVRLWYGSGGRRQAESCEGCILNITATWVANALSLNPETGRNRRLTEVGDPETIS